MVRPYCVVITTTPTFAYRGACFLPIHHEIIVHVCRNQAPHTFASFQDSRAGSLEHSIHMALTEAISELCNCSFSAKFIRMGEFRCWTSPSEVTYRSTVVGVTSHNSSKLLGQIETWVRSKVAIVRVARISLQVLSISGCAVGLSSLSEGECERSRMEEGTPTLSLVSQDPGTIQCVQSCLVQQGTSTCGN